MKVYILQERLSFFNPEGEQYHRLLNREHIFKKEEDALKAIQIIKDDSIFFHSAQDGKISSNFRVIEERKECEKSILYWYIDTYDREYDYTIISKNLYTDIEQFTNC